MFQDYSYLNALTGFCLAALHPDSYQVCQLQTFYSYLKLSTGFLVAAFQL
jgi:hypothetical protein